MSTMKLVTATITAIMTTMPCTATKSRAFRYSLSMKPMPFHSKVVSVRIAPESSSAICRPITVMIGMSAGRNACFVTRRYSLTPRERPEVTYCWPRVPITLVRIRRRKMPAVSSPRARAGRIACHSTSPMAGPLPSRIASSR